MTLDAAGISFLALAAAAGALAGALRPLFLAAGAAVGWLAAHHLAGPLGRLLERAMPAPAAQAAAAAAIFFLAVTLFGLIGRVLSRKASGERRPADRAAGALLAGTAAGLAAWVGLSICGAAAPLLPQGLQRQLARSDLAALVREHDLLGAWRRPAEEALRTLLRLAADPRGAARLASDPELRGLIDDERVRDLLGEAGGGTSGKLTASPRALQLLADPDFRDRLERAQQRLDRAGSGG